MYFGSNALGNFETFRPLSLVRVLNEEVLQFSEDGSNKRPMIKTVLLGLPLFR